MSTPGRDTIMRSDAFSRVRQAARKAQREVDRNGYVSPDTLAEIRTAQEHLREYGS